MPSVTVRRAAQTVTVSGGRGPPGPQGPPGAGSGGGGVVGETPTGLVNGSNATFATAADFVPGMVELFVNGVRQRYGAGNDFTTSGVRTLLLAVSPLAGDALQVNYAQG